MPSAVEDPEEQREETFELQSDEIRFSREDVFIPIDDSSRPSPPKSPQPDTATRPPPKASKSYHPLSLPVVALLAPSAILGLLARLGIEALANYDGKAIFPLAWVQAAGCFFMGLTVGLREPITRL